jgi:peptidoglycan/xylan/chitin deacetylase (PgdA/CDA1 family)
MICKYISISLLVIVFILITLLNCTGISSENRDSHVTLIFRLDDYSSLSDIYLEKKIIDLFAAHNLSLTIGVVPFIYEKLVEDNGPQEVQPLNPVKAKMLRKAIQDGTVDVGLHGYSHHNMQPPLRKPSEFAGMDYRSQLLKIRAGKDLLENLLSVPVDDFIPPWGTYDENTLRALVKLKFRCISGYLAGYEDPSCALKFLPFTCTLWELPRVLDYAQRIAAYQPIVCVVFHTDEFADINTEAEPRKEQINYQDFVKLIHWVSSQKDIRVRTIGQLIKENVDLSVNRFVNNKYYLRLAHLKPAIWPPNYGVYLQKDTAYDMRMKNIFKNFNKNRLINIAGVASFYFVIFIIFVILSYLFGWLISKLFHLSYTLSITAKYNAILLVFILVVYLLFMHHIQYTKLIPLVSLLGIAIGFWISFPKLKIKIKPTDSHNRGFPD